MELSSALSLKERMGLTSPAPSLASNASQPFDPPFVMSHAAHIVQFFRDDREFIGAAGRFLGEGLGAGDTCIAVATAEHHRQLDGYLFDAGLNPGALAADYRYIPLKVEDLLPTLFDARNGIDQERFHSQFDLLLRQAAARGQPVRIFGETVSILAAQGHAAAAIELEELWNELSRQHNFTLFCGYQVSAFTENPRYRKLLHTVHSHVVSDGA